MLLMLSGLKKLRICTGYELNGKRLDGFPSDVFLLDRCQPVYETLPGWDADLTSARKKSDLPKERSNTLSGSRSCSTCACHSSPVGPDREQTVKLWTKAMKGKR
jgi:adenylosuccinate synthase